jgi:hypothetical protein
MYFGDSPFRASKDNPKCSKLIATLFRLEMQRMFPLAASLALAFTFNAAEKLEAELRRLPPREVVKVSLDFYVFHAIWLAIEDHSNPGKEDLRKEGHWNGVAWAALSKAQDSSKSLEERLRCFRTLQEVIGPEAYNRGQMPLPPVHHFKEGRPRQMDIDYLSNIRRMQARTLSVGS